MVKTDDELEKLMAAALKGDNSCYNQVLVKITAFLRPYFAKRLSNQAEVEDITQETLISIHKARHTYDSSRPLKPWVFAIAQYRLADFLRSHYAKRVQYTDEIDKAADVSSLDVTEPGISYESIKKDIYKLPGKQPMILHLIHSEGYTAKEVAKKMKMTESAVKVSAHRAYKILRKRLGDNG